MAIRPLSKRGNFCSSLGSKQRYMAYITEVTGWGGFEGLDGTGWNR